MVAAEARVYTVCLGDDNHSCFDDLARGQHDEIAG